MFGLIVAGVVASRIENPRELFNDIKEKVRDEAPWLVPWTLGGATAFVSMALVVKMGNLAIHDATKIFVPGAMIDSMERMGTAVLCPDVTKTSDLWLQLVKHG